MGKPYVDQDAADRIITFLELAGIKTWAEIAEILRNAYPKWSEKQIEGFATQIVENLAERADLEAKQDDHIELPDKKKSKITSQRAISGATGVAGKSGNRYKMVRTIDGKYLGRPANIRVTTRKGKKIYAKNIKTGKKGRIK